MMGSEGVLLLSTVNQKPSRVEMGKVFQMIPNVHKADHTER